ncbi:hypothetical protein IM697_23595 [Streptomyces ferrugineus]|uniref:Uncharacterized protein n=1 Tax=Streptomyces ferrugineus TaxID=1413221 RepID=A0A7M2SDK3_9ACTN|nr:hypothetical protein [Streptomyces ferrugineus]QOV33231.1 hypothetical protein IM697_23595 [Streptomyces ferrugineus]
MVRQLSEAGAGRSAPARLLALLLALRSGHSGTAWLTAEDLQPHRTGLSETAVHELRADGWLRSPVSTPTSEAPVMACALTENRLGLQTGLSRHCGRTVDDWVWRVASHPLLRGLRADVRLAAVYLMARGHREHTGQVRPRLLARHCAHPSPEDGAQALRVLLGAGWLGVLHLNCGWRQPATYQLADKVQPLLPHAASAVTSGGSSAINVAGQERAMAAWTHAYYRRHRHSPTLRDVLVAHCAQDPGGPWSTGQLAAAADVLQSAGWLEVDGMVDHLVRPGPRYRQRMSAPVRRKRHALSPRIENRPLPSVRRAVRAPAPSGGAPQHPRPGLPPHASRHQDLPVSEETVTPRGIWLIPGARFVLQQEQA